MQINDTQAPEADDTIEKADNDALSAVDAADIATPPIEEAPPAEAKSIAAQWASEYDEGDELFCATFDADDFDLEYGEEHPDGTTVAVKRLAGRPSPGWVRKHAYLSDLERTFVLIEMNASDKALDILDSLKSAQWDEFVTAWGKDGGLIEGKSRRQRRAR